MNSASIGKFSIRKGKGNQKRVQREFTTVRKRKAINAGRAENRRVKVNVLVNQGIAGS